MAEVLNRHKDVQYSSRIASHIARQQQAHRLRRHQPARGRLPEAERNSAAVRELTSYGCPTRMHVVRLLAPQLNREDHTKDIDFSPSGIMQRWDAGYRHTKTVLKPSPGLASLIRSRASFSMNRSRSCKRRRSDWASENTATEGRSSKGAKRQNTVFRSEGAAN